MTNALVKRQLVRRRLQLVPAHEADPAAILRFERENRSYFQRSIPDRGDAYYRFEAVAASLAEARDWWEAGSDRLHVVVDQAGEIVARANLIDLAENHAHLGYRVAESHAGRGIATAAVAELLVLASTWDVNRVLAVTSADNIGSARVLEKCGFDVAGRRAASLQLGDAMLDAVDWSASL